MTKYKVHADVIRRLINNRILHFTTKEPNIKIVKELRFIKGALLYVCKQFEAK